MIKEAEMKDGRYEKKNFKFCKKENGRKVVMKANMKFYNEVNKREKQGNN